MKYPDPKMPGYTMQVDVGQVVFYDDLGWGLPMLKRLDGLRKVLDGDAATQMDFLLGRLAGHRREWEKAATKKEGLKPLTGFAILRTDLPDGTTWILGDGGIGRPFMAWLLLVNEGKQPVTIWDYQNSEGACCPGVILTDEKGKETILRPAPTAQAAGIPSIITIEPHQIVRIELELLRLIGKHGLPPGPYKLKGFYENKLKNDEVFIKKAVWVGRIESKPVEFTIVAPKVTGNVGTRTSMKGWELYIWQQGGDTYFSLLPGTTGSRARRRSRKAAVKGIEAVKPKLAELKQGQMVFRCGRHLPDSAPKEPAKAIEDYCKSIGLDVQR